MAKSKVVRVIVGTFGLFAAMLIVLFIVLINQLPGHKEIRSSLENSPSPEPTANVSTPDHVSKIAQSKNELEGSVAPEKSLNEVQAAKPTEQTRHNNGLEVIKRLMQENISNVEICSKLDSARSYGKDGGEKSDVSDAIKRVESAFGKSAESLSLAEKSDDPAVESFKPALLSILKRPRIEALLNELSNFKEKPSSEWLEKAGFYARLGAATTDILLHKNELVITANQSYHMFVLTQVVAKRPQLARDLKVINFCQSLEKNIKEGGEKDPLTEREELVKLISYSGLEPSEVGLDPKKWLDLKVEQDKKHLSLGLSLN